MYGNNDLSDRNKDNINPEDYGQKAEEQQQQEQHCAFKLFIEHPELFLPYHEQGKEKAQ